ncbi:MAG: hypothetical protein JW825_03625 [Candidatus Methanofastidiosa archaeon]|nr:hypothetical protein [Candidatus Methanofastidiosa archaeon]
MVTDVRIIVEGLRDVKRICDALELSSLGGDFSASVTSIIPTTDPLIAVNSACGADIILIATDADNSGKSLSLQMEEALQGVCPIVDKIRLPYGQNVEYFDSFLLKDAIEKAIVRAGLKALRLFQAEQDIEDATEVEESIPISEDECLPMGLYDECDDPDEEIQEGSEEGELDENIMYELNELRIDNQKYLSQINDLEKRLNEIMIDSYERYSIDDVWESLYSEQLPDLEEISLAASRLSDEIFVSGNFIFAQSLRKVEDFLREFRNTFL